MTEIFIQTAKFLMIALIVVYTIQSYLIYLRHHTEKVKGILLKEQMGLIYLLLSLGFLSMAAYSGDSSILVLFLFTIGIVTAVQVVYRQVYRYGSILLCNHICILLGTGLLMLTRLNSTKALRQIVIAAASLAVTSFFPYLLSKNKNRFRRLKWVYAALGLLLLLLVLLTGQTSYGAKLSISIGAFSIQPAEFVKLLFVFFIAAMYYEAKSFRQTVLTAVLAAVHVLLLVGARDLGTALILFVIYVVMSYAALRKWYILPIAGAAVVLIMLGAGSVMSHVSNRLIAWRDPLGTIETQGYQVSQSLFAIGTGGWFGSGLYQGRPNAIPVVEKDFIFSAIAEELGAIYAICLVLICLSCLLLFFHIAREMKDEFYRLVALGLGTSYGFQVFLTIGGCIKLIPSTGVTLPLVSYGGSSLLATFTVFALLESLYMTTKKKDSR